MSWILLVIPANQIYYTFPSSIGSTGNLGMGGFDEFFPPIGNS